MTALRGIADGRLQLSGIDVTKIHTCQFARIQGQANSVGTALWGAKPAAADGDRIMNTPDDNQQLEQWIAAVAQGDRAAFDRFYEATMPRVLAFATRQLMNEDLADDCVAETYVRVWRDAAKFDAERGCAMAWLFTICRTRGLDLLRSRQRHHELSEAVERETEFEVGDGTDDLISQVDAQSAVHPLLAELSPDQRRLIGLAFYQGLSHSEIADATGMPIGTVKSYIHRALTLMRERLGAQGRVISGPKGGSPERRAINA